MASLQAKEKRHAVVEREMEVVVENQLKAKGSEIGSETARRRRETARKLYRQLLSSNSKV